MFTSPCPTFPCLIRDYICLVSNGFAYLIFLVLVYLLPLISDEDLQSFDNFSQFSGKVLQQKWLSPSYQLIT